jgi:hypothetical protein
MDALTYIAISNPQKSQHLCQRYGYGLPQNPSAEDLAYTMQQLLADNNNMDSLKEVMELHPDKGMLVELYAPENDITNGMFLEKRAMSNYGRPWFSNASGGGEGQPSTVNTVAEKTNDFFKTSILMQQNTFMFLGFAALTAAILYAKKG